MIAVVITGEGAAATKDPRAHCRSAGKTELANSVARIYESHGSYVGCSIETGHRVNFGYESGSSSGIAAPGPFALAGSTAAYGYFLCPNEGDDCYENYVRSVDLRTGKRLRRGDFAGREFVKDIVVKRKGSMAYIFERFVRAANRLKIALARDDRRGKAVLVDRYEDASPPTGLRLERSTLHWREGDVERTKSLR